MTITFAPLPTFLPPMFFPPLTLADILAAVATLNAGTCPCPAKGSNYPNMHALDCPQFTTVHCGCHAPEKQVPAHGPTCTMYKIPAALGSLGHSLGHSFGGPSPSKPSETAPLTKSAIENAVKTYASAWAAVNPGYIGCTCEAAVKKFPNHSIYCPLGEKGDGPGPEGPEDPPEDGPDGYVAGYAADYDDGAH
jgi:hypothetical protein